LSQPAASTDRLEAMYFYMIREVIYILKSAKAKTPYEGSFASIFNSLKICADPKLWAPFIKDIVFSIEGKECKLLPKYERFRIVQQ